MNNIIQIFEYKALTINNNSFTVNHYDRLVRFNERHGNKYFTVGFKKIIFGSYVGVLNINDLTIEILPKADIIGTNEYKWRNALINMLKSCGLLKVESLSNSNLRLKNFSLLELFIHHFLNQVELIIHQNLIKNYHLEENHLNKLKGRILFDKQINNNILHKERFFTSHHIYNKENLFNLILKKALITLTNMVISNDLTSRTERLLLYFEDIHLDLSKYNIFNKLKFNKHNQHYKEALLYAQFILGKKSPSIESGKENVLAILFDMNLLFEKFIYSQIKRQESKFDNLILKVSKQKSKSFWNKRIIKPDIILEYTKEKNERIVIDTKWKILDSIKPSDADLKQMFTYNIHYGSSNSVLMYPFTNLSSTIPIRFYPSESLDKEHYCQIYFIDIFDNEGKIKSGFANKFINDIVN